MGRLGSRIPSHVQKVLSNEDDIGDVSFFYQRKAPTAVTDYTALDVADGPKTCLNIVSIGGHPANTAGDTFRIGPVTIDGTANANWPSNLRFVTDNQAGNPITIAVSPPFRYDSSLKVEWEHEGDGDDITVYGCILGSGPHSIAVVKDGEPVYMMATNLSEEQIENMNIPSGYKIVKNPDISHEDPQNAGMWDDSKGEVVDHPYWKPFYEALDNARITSRQFGFREFIANIDTPSSRGKIPFSTPDPSKGTYPPDESSDTPVEDAVRFLKKQKEEELPDKIG